MLLIVLMYIALSAWWEEHLVKIKDTARVSGELFDKIIGVVIVFIGIYFLCMAFHKNRDSIIMSLMQRYPPGLVY
jgi:hypothetical protein